MAGHIPQKEIAAAKSLQTRLLANEQRIRLFYSSNWEGF